MTDEAVREQILAGMFSAEIVESYKTLSKVEQLALAKLLRRQLNSDERTLFFIEAIDLLLPWTKCYFMSRENKFVLCLPYDENETNLARWRCLRHFFFEVTATVELFWQRHIGIIGFEPSMRIGNILLYKETVLNER